MKFVIRLCRGESCSPVGRRYYLRANTVRPYNQNGETTYDKIIQRDIYISAWIAV